MASIPSMLNNFSNFLQNHQVSCVNGLLILFTVGGEQIFKFTAFHCPCSPDEAHWYALSFMFGPAIVLGIIGVMINNLTWRLFHGCCYRSKNSIHGCYDSAQHCFAVLGRASIVPLAWLFMTFLDGNYYTCMTSSAPCEKGSEENKSLMAKSQIISWIILVSVVGFVSLAICITRCIDSVTYLQNKYVSHYREAELLHFEAIMKKDTTELAEINIQTFMNVQNLEKEDWDSISKAPKHRIKAEQTKELSYTPLHSWMQAHSAAIVQQTHVETEKSNKEQRILIEKPVLVEGTGSEILELR